MRIFLHLLFISYLFAFSSCSKSFQIAGAKSNTYQSETVKEVAPDQAILDLIEPYREKLDAEMNEVIGICEKELTKGKPECTLGNWMSDLIHEQCEIYYGDKIDFAVVNYGGIRIPSLSKGDIVVGKVFELMPFENVLVVLEVNGDVVNQLMDRVADYGGWPLSKQVQLTIKDGKVQEALVNGEAIQKNKIYKIGISDYIANGGDKCFFFQGEKQTSLDKLFRDALIENIQSKHAKDQTIDAELDGRVKVL